MPRKAKKKTTKKKAKHNPRPTLMLIPVGHRLSSANPLPVNRWLKVRAIKIAGDGKLSVRR